MSYYTSQTLIFEEDKIYFINEANKEKQVMMAWENNLMKKHADYVCQNGGDILEIGFGMGIAADYIQQNNPSSHTIIENHPQVIIKAQEWAVGKSNVTIIEGDWFDKLSELSTYDGIFCDTYGDENVNNFATALPTLVNTNGCATWWNGTGSETSIIELDGITYEEIDVTPTDNSYYPHTKYYLPKKQF